jgi:hypothetical protein
MKNIRGFKNPTKRRDNIIVIPMLGLFSKNNNIYYLFIIIKKFVMHLYICVSHIIQIRL